MVVSPMMVVMSAVTAALAVLVFPRIQVHGLAVQLQLFFRFLAVLLQFLFPLHLLFGLLTHLLFGDEETVKTRSKVICSSRLLA